MTRRKNWSANVMWGRDLPSDAVLLNVSKCALGLD